jgi:hypothetical protein
MVSLLKPYLGEILKLKVFERTVLLYNLGPIEIPS